MPQEPPEPRRPEHPEFILYENEAQRHDMSLFPYLDKHREDTLPRAILHPEAEKKLEEVFPDLRRIVPPPENPSQHNKAFTPGEPLRKPTERDASHFPEYKEKFLAWVIPQIARSCRNSCSTIIFDIAASRLLTQIIEKLNPLSPDDHQYLSGVQEASLSAPAQAYLGVLRESYVLFALLRMFYLQEPNHLKIEGVYFSPQADRDHGIDFIVVLKEPRAVVFLSVSSPQYESRPVPPMQLKRVLQESGFPTIEVNIPITWNFVKHPEDGIRSAKRMIIDAIKKTLNTQSAAAETTHPPASPVAPGRRRLSRAVKPPPPAPPSSPRGRVGLG